MNQDNTSRIVELLEELLKWTKVTSIPHVKKLLLEILPSAKEKIAYHYSDGRGSKAVAEFAGVNYVTVTKWWKKWTRAGIAETVSVKGGERARRIFLLEDFGIEVPLLKETKPKRKEAKASIEATAEESQFKRHRRKRRRE